ncbi:orotate phosphoribosyltransferase [Hymenobacter busanensis]|uniref:Orotate phosphoribosyltransferase n=1 Tax=Hymenobacter busanensis TaxID=2607656 RepID=A0A7L5A2L0_9BACT|nr:orotate phosphoribosyltransferase [Hymenobacter busanensis]KAA9333301.1 orotate phosphoribosyltransferase [Hymenobacter busanensis]QHJ08020.1 orotate phosphoribosyltransferase [Hymenobacter busanensis]
MPYAPSAFQTQFEQQLRGEDALLSGHFRLSSGLHSDTYVQCARFLRRPELAAPALAELARLIQEAGLQPDVVVGPAMGGVVVSYELARQLGTPSLFTERDADTKMVLRRGFTLDPGQKIIIAEDVVTTGKSTLEVAAVLRQMGVEVLGVACLIDRTGGRHELDFPLFALLPVQAATYQPETCPLCAKGLPAVKPGSRPDAVPALA